MAALAAGADVNAPYRTPRAQRLVGATNEKDAQQQRQTQLVPAAAAAAEQQEEQQPDLQPGTATWQACGTVTALHAAAAAGCVPLLEFMLQNNANCQHTDARRRTPLHYALLHQAPECAKLLLRRWPSLAGAADASGRAGMDLVLAQGRVSDEELFLLLASHGGDSGRGGMGS